MDATDWIGGVRESEEWKVTQKLGTEVLEIWQCLIPIHPLPCADIGSLGGDIFSKSEKYIPGELEQTEPLGWG